MALLTPKIDKRTALDISRQVQDLLKIYTPEWNEEFDPMIGEPKSASAALISVFARYVEVILQQLNQVPNKNFLAFLDLLGASLLPPQSSRAPLTFFLASGRVEHDVVVPIGTQVAAPPAEGETGPPVIFETERDVVVTSAELTSVFVRDPEQDLYADHSPICTLTAESEVPVFRGNRQIEHILYLGCRDLSDYPPLQELRLTFDLEDDFENPIPRRLRWEIWDGEQGISITPEEDNTENLTQNGDVVFTHLSSRFCQQTVLGESNCWLRCRLLTPITPADDRRRGMVHDRQLPSVSSVTMQVSLYRRDLDVEAAFTNLIPVDLSKEFFPFGEHPKFGDTLYLANAEAFSKADSNITLHVDLTNPASGGPDLPLPRTNSSGGARLRWECWNGEAWVGIGISAPERSRSLTSYAFEDTTRALTESGRVRFRLPDQLMATTVNGADHFGLRVRIVAGDYGREARYEPVDPNDLKEGYRTIPATLSPPSIRSVKVDYTLAKEVSPKMVTYNDFAYELIVQKPFRPFQRSKDARPTLYLGFTLPSGRPSFPNRTLSLFACVADFKYGEKTVPISPRSSRNFGEAGSVVEHRFSISNASSHSAIFDLTILGSRWDTAVVPHQLTLDAGESRSVTVHVPIPLGMPAGGADEGALRLTRADEPDLEYRAALTTCVGERTAFEKPVQLVWEYWNGDMWVKLSVRDDSKTFVRPGLIQFLAPSDFAAHSEFGKSCHWLRIRWESGTYAYDPRLRRLLLNTMMATQTVTIRNETLGSSNGRADQQFPTAHRPVLCGQQLEVCEPEMPFAPGQAAIKDAKNKDAMSYAPDVSGHLEEIWVRWHEVPNFHGSRPHDRHYVLDRQNGVVYFGDGINGLIPPLGAGNICMAYYQTGGGIVGNKPANTIAQLKTTIPYVERVINTEAAAGGANVETFEALFKRMPRTVRHRNRAVTLEDYEDLAMLASPAVARAKCVPNYNLAVDPDARHIRPDTVSLIVVPRSTVPRPLPSLELIDRVQRHLDAHRIPTAELIVVGPEYICVEVEAEVALSSLEGSGSVEQILDQKISNFLHPLSGGADGMGRAFGRKPHRSDLYALIEAVEGVDHVRLLNITETPDRPGAERTDRFLAYSGIHKIRLTFQAS